jgi:predicted MPP superfamily phosphohydrolase
MKITKYFIHTQKKGLCFRATVVSDLHSRPFKKVLEAIKKTNPDMILLPGDILEIASNDMEERNRNGYAFLKEISSVAPCYYCYGNHELYSTLRKKETDPALDLERQEIIRSLGIHLINDSFETLEENSSVMIGGLVCGRDMLSSPTLSDDLPSFMNRFKQSDAFKILLCHYPHLYEKHFKHSEIDLIISGHAHGGQWRIFGRGIYAPHQGLFPKYTSGIHDGKHVISRGAVNNARPIPRLFNPCEVISIIVSDQDTDTQ